MIIVNSPFNRYLEKLLENIKKANPNIPNNIKILVSRDFEINAANKGEGTIIVNQYLLEAIDDEEQLLYTLCHEIAHQHLEHVTNKFKKRIYLND